jgi:Kef-type K+ transport system membrane component KefB
VLATGAGIQLALILAGIAPATAPAATIDVVREARTKGPFRQLLLGIVAVDDAWGLILFSVCSAAAAAVAGMDGYATPLGAAGWEIGGAVLLGVTLGVPAAKLTGLIEPGEPTLSEALGIVFLCGGLAIWLGVSFLIASMVLGVVVANLAKHHRRPFHAIENIEWPFMVLFFVLAGASLQLTALETIGLVGAVYIIARAVGRVLGGWLGGWLCRADTSTRRWIGWALMPQAGVALGMALVASSRSPHLKEIVLPIVISSTILFELAGPVLTRHALRRVERAGRQ